jgi:hypothetical protein
MASGQANGATDDHQRDDAGRRDRAAIDSKERVVETFVHEPYIGTIGKNLMWLRQLAVGGAMG